MTTEYRDGDAWKQWKKDYEDAAADPDKQDDLMFNQPSVAGVHTGQLIPYYLQGVKCPMIFNGHRAVQGDKVYNDWD